MINSTQKSISDFAIQGTLIKRVVGDLDFAIVRYDNCTINVHFQLDIYKQL